MSESALQTIKRSHVPEYLRSSELYLSFSDELDDEICVPANCFKTDATVENAADLEHILLTMRFWILRRFPHELITFLVNTFNKDCTTVLQKYALEFPSVLELVKDLHAKFHKLDNCHLACMYGRLDFLEYFVERGEPLKVLDLQLAANDGHLDCLSYVHNKIHAQFTGQCLQLFDLEKPIRGGHYDCLVFMVKLGVPVNELLCRHAIRHNRLNCLAFFVAQLQKESIEIGDATWLTTIHNSNDCLNYLLTTYPAALLQPNLVNLACQFGSSTSLRILLKQNSMVGINAVTEAAEGGSYECLQLLHSDVGLDCWIPSTMAAAAGAGQLQLVKRLHEQGCPWDETAIAAAMQHNRQQCLQYLRNVK